jgi:hypothetical protein
MLNLVAMEQHRLLSVQRMAAAVAVQCTQSQATSFLLTVEAAVQVAVVPTVVHLVAVCQVKVMQAVLLLALILLVVGVVVLVAQVATAHQRQVVQAEQQVPTVTQVHLFPIQVAAVVAVLVLVARQERTLAQEQQVRVELLLLIVVVVAAVVQTMPTAALAAQVVSCFVRSPLRLRTSR